MNRVEPEVHLGGRGGGGGFARDGKGGGGGKGEKPSITFSPGGGKRERGGVGEKSRSRGGPDH